MSGLQASLVPLLQQFHRDLFDGPRHRHGEAHWGLLVECHCGGDGSSPHQLLITSTLQYQAEFTLTRAGRA